MKIIDSGPFAGLPRAHFRLVLIDPPWKFSAGKSRNPSNHYKTMPIPDIMALPVRDLLHPDGARVLTWFTAPLMNRIGDVQRAWGLKYSTSRFWVKLWSKEGMLFLYMPSDTDSGSLAAGTGFEVIGNVEPLVIFKHGRPESLKGKPKPHSVILGHRKRHLEKPIKMLDELERLFAGPRLELFSRTDHPGFQSWGDQAGLLNGR